MILTENDITEITKSIKDELSSTIIYMNKQLYLLYQIVKINGLDKTNSLLVTNYIKSVDDINLQVDQNSIDKTTKLTRL